jgi:hypothetical protein
MQQLGAHCPKSLTVKCTHLLQGSIVKDSFGRTTATNTLTTGKSVLA